MTRTRRSFLRRLGLAGIGTAAGIAALPDPPAWQLAERPDGSSPIDGGPQEEITTERETEYALWQYYRRSTGFEPTSPINVVVTLADTDRTIEDVMAVFLTADWYRRPLEYKRFALNVRENRFERQHATAAQTYYGSYGRMHVRIWSFGDVVSIQAHEDSVAHPVHLIESYETGKYVVEWLFAEAGWDVVPDAVRFHNAKGPDHDGRVTVIQP